MPTEFANRNARSTGLLSRMSTNSSKCRFSARKGNLRYFFGALRFGSMFGSLFHAGPPRAREAKAREWLTKVGGFRYLWLSFTVDSARKAAKRKPAKPKASGAKASKSKASAPAPAARSAEPAANFFAAPPVPVLPCVVMTAPFAGYQPFPPLPPTPQPSSQAQAAWRAQSQAGHSGGRADDPFHGGLSYQERVRLAMALQQRPFSALTGPPVPTPYDRRASSAERIAAAIAQHNMLTGSNTLMQSSAASEPIDTSSLSPAQAEALTIALQGESFFFTGAGGTGKVTIIWNLWTLSVFAKVFANWCAELSSENFSCKASAAAWCVICPCDSFHWRCRL
jgi:hypothetical protein